MNRRDTVLAVIALGAASWPLISSAQPTQKLRRIGFLLLDTSSSLSGQRAQRLFPEALRKLGYKAGENLSIEWRWADGRAENLPGLAADLVRMKVEIIVARTNIPIRAAIDATKTIPIVMLNGSFPVENKFIDGLAHPGGNVTGTSFRTPAIVEKELQILKELVPSTVRIAVLWNANVSGTAYEQLVQTSLQRAATALGMTVQYFEVRQPGEIAAALDRIAASGVPAFWYSGDPILRTRTADIVAFLRDHKLASIGAIPGFANDGGLADYAADEQSAIDRTASYVDRILKGAQPSDLPVEEPTKFEFAINLKTAKVLGLTIPQSLLVSANRLIE
jgi:putative ABC transport system substrate-binding protein